MQSLPHLLISLALAAGCATAIAADKAAAPAKTTDELAARQAALDKIAAVPGPADTKASRAADRKLLAAVRRAIIHDNTLSMAAHNVKLKASAGVITITGDVRTAAEKTKVEAIARKVAGVTSVESEITVPQPAAAKAKPKPAVRENTRADAKPEKTR
jgi:osmotically-inducible protein OsmY